MNKNEIRKHIQAVRNELTEDVLKEENRKIRERLFALECFKKSTMLFSYVSFGKEADTHEIIIMALQMNKRVYVPRVENKEMNFYEIHDLDGLIRSDYGILEPVGDIRHRYRPSSEDSKNKLMLIPGLAFDIRGNRIGYGAGFYDRYLGGYPENEWEKLALAYDFQIINNISTDIYDIPADYILTPNRFISCRE